MSNQEAPWTRRDRLKAAGVPAPAVAPATAPTSSKTVTEARLKREQMALMKGIAAVIKDERARHDAERDKLQSEIDDLKQLVKDLAQELRSDIRQAGNYAPDAMYQNATAAKLAALKAGMSKYAIGFMRERACFVSGKENAGIVMQGALAK